MIPRNISDEFRVYPLTDLASQRLELIAWHFSELLDSCKEHIGTSEELILITNKLHEAWYFAKKAINQNPENQEK